MSQIRPAIAHSDPIVQIDGEYGEGGGALLRTAILMSAQHQIPFEIFNIRGGLSHHGLDIEDHTILHAIGHCCGAEVIGGDIGSQRVRFLPSHPIGPVKLEVPPRGKGRGANTLVLLSTLLPIAAKSGVFTELTAIGETYGPHTLTFDYFANVTLPMARKMGVYAWCDQQVAGFGRETYGEVFIEVEPSAISGTVLEDRGSLKGCYAIITTSNVPPTIGQRAEAHLKRLSSFANVPMHVQVREVPGSGPGTAITAWCEFERGIGGFVSVGTRGVRIETISQSAFESLTSFITSGATVDEHLADQLFMFSLFADSESLFVTPRITKRLTTMAWVAKQFRPFHITITGQEEEPGTVSIKP